MSSLHNRGSITAQLSVELRGVLMLPERHSDLCFPSTALPRASAERLHNCKTVVDWKLLTSAQGRSAAEHTTLLTIHPVYDF
jgi:hypothetical protein